MKLRISYGLMAVVLLGALWAGTHASHVPTNDERALTLEQSIKCPVCRGQSVAESDSEASKAIRTEIVRRISAGESDSEIRIEAAKDMAREFRHVYPEIAEI